MKIILGQGNPGQRYQTTRHNTGWLLLELLAGDTPFRLQSKFSAHIAELSIAGEKVLLVKPTTFYNETGRVARSLLDFYKLDTGDLLVVHDDLALPFGTIRVREKGSDAGNNGIKSLNAHIGQNFWRLRIGVWNELRHHLPDTDFVLSRFTKAEITALTTHIAPSVQQLIEQLCHETIEPTSLQVLPEK